MKKFFTLTVAFVLSFSAYAQTSVFQRDLNNTGINHKQGSSK